MIGTEAFIFEWKKSIWARVCGSYIQRCRFAGVSIGHWTVISHKVPKQNKISQDQFQGCCNLNFGNCWAASYPDVTLQKRVFYYINLARAIGVLPGLVLCMWVSQFRGFYWALLIFSPQHCPKFNCSLMTKFKPSMYNFKINSTLNFQCKFEFWYLYIII